jgi:LCP family protein required for cell wall assembly
VLVELPFRRRRSRLLVRLGTAGALVVVSAVSVAVAGGAYVDQRAGEVVRVDTGDALDSADAAPAASTVPGAPASSGAPVVTLPDLDAAAARGPVDVENYLIVGSDTRVGSDPTSVDFGGIGPTGAEADGQRSDTMMVLRYDPKSRSGALLSIPRDLWVTRADTGRKDKINGAFNGGPQALIKTVRDALGIPVNHYVQVDFSGFKRMVDALGGIAVPFDRYLYDKQTGFEVTKPGCVRLDGLRALQYVRSRHLQTVDNRGRYRDVDGTGDLGRIDRQQAFIARLLSKAIRVASSDPLSIARMLDAASSSVQVDKGVDLIALAGQFRRISTGALTTYTLPGFDRTVNGLAVLVLDNANSRPILDFFAGRTTVAPPSDGVAALAVAPEAAPAPSAAPAPASPGAKAPATTAAATTAAATTAAATTAAAAVGPAVTGPAGGYLPVAAGACDP